MNPQQTTPTTACTPSGLGSSHTHSIKQNPMHLPKQPPNDPNPPTNPRRKSQRASGHVNDTAMHLEPPPDQSTTTPPDEKSSGENRGTAMRHREAAGARDVVEGSNIEWQSQRGEARDQPRGDQEGQEDREEGQEVEETTNEERMSTVQARMSTTASTTTTTYPNPSTSITHTPQTTRQ
ncbi:hypothetical protein PAXINDRAFT_16580 [Paxillus involutus ATCC 200175]|uniref:Uncharacterized protein n=1 Tax=Paxillus involutus ATCC 200175 TaxID=664439 RepID=A0A0C9TT77_PAXIN|nr:hypothetical protein PAXINDRAFT_16580 [Paxillus involutus ATCC 200175]